MGTEDQGRAGEPEAQPGTSLEGVPFPPAPRDDEAARLRDIEFPVVLRGYDRGEVDAYVRRVNRLIAELEVSRSPQAAIRHALEQVGEQTRGILQQAHESAARITSEAEQDTEALLRSAEQDARNIRKDAEQRVVDLDAEADAIWQERRRLLEDVRRISEQLGRIAEGGLQAFPEAHPALPQAEETGALDGPPAATAAGAVILPDGEQDADLEAEAEQYTEPAPLPLDEEREPDEEAGEETQEVEPAPPADDETIRMRHPDEDDGDLDRAP